MDQEPIQFRNLLQNLPGRASRLDTNLVHAYRYIAGLYGCILFSKQFQPLTCASSNLNHTDTSRSVVLIPSHKMSAQVRLATMGQLKGARPVDHIKDHLRQACGLENLPYVNKLICSTWAFSNTAYQVVAMRIGKLKESEDHGVFAVCFPYAQDTSDSDRQLRFYQKMGHKKTEMNKSQMGSVDYLTPFCWIFEGINENAVECLRAFLQTWFVLRNYTKIDPVIDFELLARSATIIQDKRGTPNHSKDDADCAGGLAPRPLTEDHERQVCHIKPRFTLRDLHVCNSIQTTAIANLAPSE